MKNIFTNLSNTKGSSTPLHIQITEILRQHIQSGDLKAGDKLTPTRSLANDLGISRTTITTAYDQLKAEGFIQGQVGSAYYVNPIGNIELKSTTTKIKDFELDENYEPIKVVHPSSADMRLFPYRQWARCVAKVARTQPKALLDQTDAFGDIELRKQIAIYLDQWRGLNVSVRQIIITAGSIDALEICIRGLIEKSDIVGLEDPGYLPLRRYIQQQHIKPVWLAIDEQSAIVPKQKSKNKNPKLVILTPSHQFPLGGVMPPARRAEFLDWADKTGNWIIEDDYDSEFRYAGQPIPALTGFTDNARSIYIGSFAKIFSSGLRLGFLVLPKELTSQFAQILKFTVSKASITSQRPLALFMQGGEFYRHLRRVRRIYAERRKILIQYLSDELEHIINFDDHQAGMQIMIRLPENYNDIEISEAARKQGLIVDALSTHYANLPRDSGLLLGFCAYNENELKLNIQILKEVIESCTISGY